MAITEFSKQYHERMFPGYESRFLETDPEFIERFDNFAFDEVINQDDLDDRTRMMAILATLLGCQGIDEFKAMLPAAINFGVTPVVGNDKQFLIKVISQSIPYIGYPRSLNALSCDNDAAKQMEQK